MSDSAHFDNPYRCPAFDSGSPLPRQFGTLIARGWLYRKVRLPDPINKTIEYNGRGIGFETVRVDGAVVARERSWSWFVPHFDFMLKTNLGDLAASLDVRVSPWLALSLIQITIEGQQVYIET